MKSIEVNEDGEAKVGTGNLAIRPGQLKRSPSQKVRDRKIISSMYLQGSSQAKIGEHIGVSQATISRYLRALRVEWLESSLIDLNERKGMELAKLDKLEEELWEAWERSKLNAIVRRTETNNDPDLPEDLAVSTRNIKTESERDGDPRFLVQIQKCINKRSEILGLNAPKKVHNEFDELHIKIGMSAQTEKYLEQPDPLDSPEIVDAEFSEPPDSPEPR